MTSHQVQLLFVDLALILFLARGFGHVMARLGQPPVVGEILAGIMLGPSLVHGAISGALFPADIRPLLTGMADVGVALFMFAVGLEMDGDAMRGRGRAAVGAALGSMLVPFALGVGLAFYLLRGHEVKQTAPFVVFIGLAVSVTAFPVLARILTDRGLGGTPLGSVALATAAAVDIAAWTALAGIQAVTGGGAQHWRVALAIPYLAVMLLLVRPALRGLLAPGGLAAGSSAGSSAGITPQKAGVVLIGALLSAAATEAMGMHFIFGAFLFGVLVRRAGAATVRAELHERTAALTSLLLPVYFVVAGLKVDLGGLGAGQLVELGAICAVAVAGKLGGTYVGSRTQGLPPRPSAALAVLMNTRGLTELVILGVGLQLGLLDGSLYSLMVVMAVATTAMTGPLLSRVYAAPVEVSGRAGPRRPEPIAASPA
jgi:Kef-type K+ transport system membrane component KefB